MFDLRLSVSGMPSESLAPARDSREAHATRGVAAPPGGVASMSAGRAPGPADLSPHDEASVRAMVCFDGDVAALAFPERLPPLSLEAASAKLNAYRNQVPMAVSLDGDIVIWTFARTADAASGRPGGLDQVRMRVEDLNKCLRGAEDIGPDQRIDGRQNIPVMALRVVKDIMRMPGVPEATAREIVENFVRDMRTAVASPGGNLVEARNNAFSSLVAALRLGDDPHRQLEQDMAVIDQARSDIPPDLLSQFDRLIADRRVALSRRDYAAAADAQGVMGFLAEQHGLAPIGAQALTWSEIRPDPFPIADDPAPAPGAAGVAAAAAPAPAAPAPAAAPADLPASILPTPEEWLNEWSPRPGFHLRDARSRELAGIDQALQQLAETRARLNDPAIHAAPMYARQAREGVFDLTYALLKAIDDWDASKKAKSPQGVNENPRAAAVRRLKQRAEIDFAALNEPAQRALEAQRQAWSGPASGFTNPRYHNPRQFQYVINGLTVGNEWADRTLENPDLYNENPGIISASVINQDKNTVWAYSGYIFQPSPANFHSFRPGDQGVRAQEGRRHLETLTGKFGLPSPAEALRQTPAHQHNELTVVGANWNGAEEAPPPRLTVAGIYVIEDDARPGTPKRLPEVLKDRSGMPIQVGGRTVFQLKQALPRERMAAIERVAAERRLPIVYIRQSNGGMAKEGIAWATNIPDAARHQYININELTAEERAAVVARLDPSITLVEPPAR